MDFRPIFCAGNTEAARYAGRLLQEWGLTVTNRATEEVGHLLLDVPSFEANGRLRLGGSVEALLADLPKDVVIYGGNLNHPALAGYRTVDFLKDEGYLARNAYITAEAALDVALPYLKVTFRNCPMLVIGWGRIGKCLARLLQALGAEVTVSARRSEQLAMLAALGFQAEHTAHLEDSLGHYRLIFNTVPVPVLSRAQMANCRADCVKIELASVDGMEDGDVIIARGLPGVHFPESSGALIAKTFLRYFQEEAL